MAKLLLARSELVWCIFILICNVLLSIYSVIYLIKLDLFFFLSKILTIWGIVVNKTLTIFSSVLGYFLNMLAHHFVMQSKRGIKEMIIIFTLKV